jgi:hypothetical protein
VPKNNCEKLIVMGAEDAGAKASVDVGNKTAAIGFGEKKVKLGDLRETFKDLGYNYRIYWVN